MQIKFYKYHGTGNDFILIDNRDLVLNSNNFNYEKIAQLCHRRFGIGADGLMLLENHSEADFEMKYYNSDGNLASMCGNGGRCIVAFAKKLKIIENKTTFLAPDGIHHAEIEKDIVSLEMSDVKEITKLNDTYFLDTGSPHHVSFCDNIEEIDIYKEGKKIRYSSQYSPKGTNVNFVEIKENNLIVRTYERGVEDETYSCGTGVTASAIAVSELMKNEEKNKEYKISTKGGNLKVCFNKQENYFTNIHLEGKASFVFEGEIIL